MSIRNVVGKEEGFTLVELAIAVAIAGIVAMLAIPSMRGVFPRMRLSNDTITLSNEIVLARARAISQNREYRIIFNTADDTYTLRDQTGVGGGPRTFATNTLNAGIELTSVVVQDDTPATDPPDASSILRVRPVGDVGREEDDGDIKQNDWDQYWLITLQTSDGNYRKRVKVKNTGRVSVQRWTGGSYVED